MIFTAFFGRYCSPLFYFKFKDRFYLLENSIDLLRIFSSPYKIFYSRRFMWSRIWETVKNLADSSSISSRKYSTGGVRYGYVAETDNTLPNSDVERHLIAQLLGESSTPAPDSDPRNRIRIDANGVVWRKLDERMWFVLTHSKKIQHNLEITIFLSPSDVDGNLRAQYVRRVTEIPGNTLIIKVDRQYLKDPVVVLALKNLMRIEEAFVPTAKRPT